MNMPRRLGLAGVHSGKAKEAGGGVPTQLDRVPFSPWFILPELRAQSLELVPERRALLPYSEGR